MLKNPELLEEFFEENKYDYPDITQEQMKEIVFGPWRFLKKDMENGELGTVRFKYFGTFQVYEGRARNMLKQIKRKFEEQRLDHKIYFRVKEMLETYINKIDNDKED